MNLNKSFEFFNPSDCKERIHIVGCGSVGSTIAENLARFGLTKITLWDFDEVEEKNVVNQMFFHDDAGKKKVDALKELLMRINPDIEKGLKLKPDGWNGEQLSGWIFLAVDSIEIRRQIVEKHKGSPYVRAMFDFRTGLTDAQHFAADWEDQKAVENLANSMMFDDETANKENPVSACGVTLGVAPTVRLIVAYGVSNFLNLVKGLDYKKIIIADVFDPTLTVF